MPRNKIRHQRRLNPLNIPDHVKRDLILEGDKVYCGNMTQVRDQVLRREITPDTAANIRNWLIAASLRRNHVPFKESQRLLRAA